MTRLYLVFIIIQSTQSVFCQTKYTNEFYCNYNLRPKKVIYVDVENRNLDIEKQIKLILSAIGINESYNLIPDTEIVVAAAYSSKLGEKFIFYNPSVLLQLQMATTKWSVLSIISHEIGHHILGHTKKNEKDVFAQRIQELEADEFSGKILCKLGASKPNSLQAANLLMNNEVSANSTHPKKTDRIKAIIKGYNESYMFEELSIDSPEEFDYNVKVQSTRITEANAKRLLELTKYAIELSPDNLNLMFKKAKILQKLKRKDESKKIFYDILDRIDNNNFYELIIKSDVYLNLELNEEAENILKHTEKICNQNDEIERVMQLSKMAVLKIEQKKYYEVIKCYDTLITLVSTELKSPFFDILKDDFYNNRGVAKGKVGDSVGACNDLALVCKKNKNCSIFKDICK